MIIANSELHARLVGYLPSHIQLALVEKLLNRIKLYLVTLVTVWFNDKVGLSFKEFTEMLRVPLRIETPCKRVRWCCALGSCTVLVPFRVNALEMPTLVQARIHTDFHCFTEISHILHNKWVLIKLSLENRCSRWACDYCWRVKCTAFLNDS